MPLFSPSMLEQAREGFQLRLSRAGESGRAAAAQLEALSDPDLAAAVRWLYAASPLSDWANYPFSLFLNCARHGVYLRQRDLELPEDLFLHYVLPLRVNEEELSDCRALFYDCLAPRLEGLAPCAAAVAVNYWCAEQVTYRSTDDRTRSALGVYRTGWGRCGEESTFAVNAYRAAGIPARQIYTPRWAHCDDNHAWVEIWVDGEWHYLGACEPEEVLDRGWFTSAASRAMVIHCRRFSPVPGGGEVISQDGPASVLNCLSRYAKTRVLTVRVTDPCGEPVEGAEVSFGVVNMCEAYPVAVLHTGSDGTARLTCGLGSVLLRARKDGLSCEKLVDSGDAAELTLPPEAPAQDVWENFAITAPRDTPPSPSCLTEAQKALGREKAAAAAAVRTRRTLPPPPLEAAHLSPENSEALLAVLSQKDLQDVEPEVLEEALELGEPFRDSGALFWPYIVCPRVADEPLRAQRRDILARFTPEQKSAFRADPAAAWAYLRETIRFDPDLEYSPLVTLPLGVLTAGTGSPLSRRILFVTLCRALGVPARLNPADRRAEYWDGGAFRCVEAPPESASLVLEGGGQYRTDFALAVLEDGEYRTLELSGLTWTDGQLTVSLRPGDYRILTDNRLPNGDLFVSAYRLHLEPGERRTVRLQKYPAHPRRMLADYALEEFFVSAQDGQSAAGSQLTGERTVLLWLEEGAEPTEHILNELLDRREDFQTMRLVFLLRGPEALEDRKLRQALEALPDAEVYYDRLNVEPLARRLYVDPDKLPLIVVTSGPLHAVYASSGYNVGAGDMILNVCRAVRERDGK